MLKSGRVKNKCYFWKWQKLDGFECGKWQKCPFWHYQRPKTDKFGEHYLINNQIFETRLVSKITKILHNNLIFISAKYSFWLEFK